MHRRVNLLLVALLLAAASFSASAQPVPRSVRKAWSPAKLSDPAKHDGQQYRYLVHMLNPCALNGKTTPDVQKIYKHFNSGTGPSQVSLSLIDQDHRGTYGPLGFIVRVPTKNIEEMAPADMRRYSKIPGLELETDVKPIFVSPAQLLKQTGAGSYNEVVARRQSSRGRLRIVGLAQVDLPGDWSAWSDLAVLKKSFDDFARQSGLPVVHLPAPNHL